MAWDAVEIHHLLSHSAGTHIDTTYFWLIRDHPEYWPEAIGMAASLGSIESGKLADLIILPVASLGELAVLAPATLIDPAIAWYALDARTVRASFTNRYGCRT